MRQFLLQVVPAAQDLKHTLISKAGAEMTCGSMPGVLSRTFTRKSVEESSAHCSAVCTRNACFGYSYTC